MSTSKLNEYGFLPKVGHWVRVMGVLSKDQNDFHDPSISRVSRLEHIDPPMKKKEDPDKLNKIEYARKGTETRRILNALSDIPIDFEHICIRLGAKDNKETRNLRNTLKILRRKGLVDINENGWILK